jgi:hypothetical protein
MSNAPMVPDGGTSFFNTWMDALTKPREATFAAIAASPKARATTAYLWVFLTYIVSALVAILIQGPMIRSRLAEAGVTGDLTGSGLGVVALELLCGTPIGAAIGTAFFAIGVALVQWVAKMFGGRGSNDQLAYCFAAIAAPFSLVSSALTLLSAIPFVGFCFGVIGLAAGIYAVVLQILAVKAVNQFGWGQAIASWLIPGLALFLICCCVVVAVSSVMGLAIGNVFSSLGQSPIP